MRVFDASCLFDVVTNGKYESAIKEQDDGEPVAPHVIDSEVLGIIRKKLFSGELTLPEADTAVAKLIAWPGERYNHRALIVRAWELRNNVRHQDALYVVLAEKLQVPLLTLDVRLSHAPGIRCDIIVPNYC